MNIILLNHYAGSPKMGMEFRPYYLAQEWIKNGHNVTIVAATQSHIRKINLEITEKYREEKIDGINYIWINTRKYSGNGIGRIFNMFDYIKGVYGLLKKLKGMEPDAVIASSTYPLDNYPAYKLAKKTGSKYFYEVHDLWPLSPQLLGGYSKWHPFIVFMQMAETFAYKHVDKVISILPCAEEHMKEHGLGDGKFINIPNGIYLPEVQNPEPLSDEFLEVLPKEKTIVGYCGTLGTANALHVLIEAANLLKDERPDVFFAIVGKGPEKEALQKIIDSYGLSNIKIYDPIYKTQVQSFISLCTIMTIIWNDSPLYKYGTSPNKLFDYMYASKPVLQAINNVGNDIPKDSGCGTTCGTKPQEVKDSLLEMLSFEPKKLEEMGHSGHDFVMKNHTYEVLSENFINAIK